MVDEVWSHTPAAARVTVDRATVELPMLTRGRTPDLPGGLGESLVKWRNEQTITLDPSALNNATVPMNLPDRTGDQ